MQKRLTHYWEIFGRYIWWIVFVAIFNGLQYLQSIREELPSNWQKFLTVVSIFPDWDPIVWLTIFFFIALFMILESAHRRIIKIEDEFKAYKHEPPQIKRISQLHTIGVDLRNEGIKIRSNKLLPEWQNRYEEWTQELISLVSEIYYSMGQRLKRLNRIPETGDYAFPKAINREHRRDLRTLEKRLEIVEQILNKYAGLD